MFDQESFHLLLDLVQNGATRTMLRNHRVTCDKTFQTCRDGHKKQDAPAKKSGSTFERGLDLWRAFDSIKKVQCNLPILMTPLVEVGNL